MKPVAQISIGKQVQAQHGSEIGERPVSLREVVEPLEQQGDQGCPNLDMEGVLSGTDKALDFKVLLECFEEQLDLPTVLVDVGDGGRPEVEVIGHEHDLALLDRVPDDDAAQSVLEGLLSQLAGEADDLVAKDIAGRRRLA